MEMHIDFIYDCKYYVRISLSNHIKKYFFVKSNNAFTSYNKLPDFIKHLIDLATVIKINLELSYFLFIIKMPFK